jgi:hypothetical protein
MSVKGSWQRPDGDRKKFDEEYDRIFGKIVDTALGDNVKLLEQAARDAITYGRCTTNIEWEEDKGIVVECTEITDTLNYLLDNTSHEPHMTFVDNEQEDLGDVNDTDK